MQHRDRVDNLVTDTDGGVDVPGQCVSPGQIRQVLRPEPACVALDHGNPALVESDEVTPWLWLGATREGALAPGAE
ncbi:MAG: hypothetical protein ACRDQ9_08035 [Pseudonocardiaceae bacterium]